MIFQRFGVCLLAVQAAYPCCHNYNNGRFGFIFFVAISIVGGGIYFHFFSRCSDEDEEQFFEKERMRFQCFGAYLLVVQATCLKAYKKTATNSSIYYCAH
jgi:hypothetical protein